MVDQLPVRMPAAFRSPALVRVTGYVPDLLVLTPLQHRFVEEYLIDLDARQAAVRAGVPVREAANRGRTYMRHPRVREAVGRAMAERSRRTGINADRVLERLGALALGNPASIFNEHGGLKKPKDMDEYDQLLLAGVKTRRTLALNPETGKMEPEIIEEIKVIDQLAALSMAMKHLGMLNEKIDVNVTSLADRLREAQLRRDGKLPNGSAVIEGDVIDAEYEEMSGEELSDRDRAGDDAAEDDDEPGGSAAISPQGVAADTAPQAVGALAAVVLDYDPLTGEPLIDWDPLND